MAYRLSSQCSPESGYLSSPSRGLVGIGILLIMLFIGLIITGALSAAFVGDAPDRTTYLWQSVIQSVFAFILPAIVTIRLLKYHPIYFIEADRALSAVDFLLVAVLFISAYFCMGQLIYYNEQVSLPDCVALFEENMRIMEEAAAKTTAIILGTTSVGGLIAGIAVIAILTGIAEELFFRGTMQNILLRSGINPDVSIWLTAFIFSAMHMQFYGFFPRLLLGACFGYLLLWSGKLWVSSFAHALNNASVVVGTWLVNKGIVGQQTLDFGVVKDGFPWYALVSAVLVAAVLVIIHSYYSGHTCKRATK